MKTKPSISIACLLFFACPGFSQNPNKQAADSSSHIQGLVLDSKSKAPLPYANIYVLGKQTGTVSNEDGRYSLNTEGLDDTDTVRFQFIGYKTVKQTVETLKTTADVMMAEDVFNISEILVFGNTPDAREIVKKVIPNKEKNYPPRNSLQKFFLRVRTYQDFDKFELSYKKSSIPDVDLEMIRLIEEKFPRDMVDFEDCLGNIYINLDAEDSIPMKLDPVRSVLLKQENISEFDHISAVFEKAFRNTAEDEYWKAKSGIVGTKLSIDFEQDTIRTDTTVSQKNKDVAEENMKKIKYFKGRVKPMLEFASLDDKKQWDFLYKTGRYDYRVSGGTRVNGEDVYIIDFEPTAGGLYQGRMYIAMNTYSLVRADFAYATGKTGSGFHLLGIDYDQTQFAGSIYFEKSGDAYQLKYFSYNHAYALGFDRKVSMLKKRKQFLFDKTLMELKMRLDFETSITTSVEYMVLDQQEISQQQFVEFEEAEYMDLIYVDQFDDSLWKGYNIIEPVQRMREYKKQEISFD